MSQYCCGTMTPQAVAIPFIDCTTGFGHIHSTG
jgi:hypothetical protein